MPLIGNQCTERRGVPFLTEAVSLDAVVSKETRCLPTPRDVSTGSIVVFGRKSAEAVLGPMVSKEEERNVNRVIGRRSSPIYRWSLSCYPVY